MSKKTFHINIVDNETNEVVFDTDIRALIGGVKTEDGAQGLVLASCNDLELARAIVAAEHSTKTVRDRKDGAFALLTEMIAVDTETEEVDKLKNN
jgi:hypothetical protein